MALVSRRRCSRDARSRGGGASCFPGPGAALSFFRACSVVEGEAGIFEGALATEGVLAAAESALATLSSVRRVVDGVAGWTTGSTPTTPPCGAPLTGGSPGGPHPGPTPAAVRAK